MKNKNEIIEDIKVLQKDNPIEFKGLKQELKIAFTDMSTDDEGHSPKNKVLQVIKEKELPVIKEGSLKGDKYGNTPLSLAIEEGNIEQVKQMFFVESILSNAELLKIIALDMTTKEVQDEYNILQEVASTIYAEAKYQLDLMGEETIEIVNAYNFGE